MRFLIYSRNQASISREFLITSKKQGERFLTNHENNVDPQISYPPENGAQFESSVVSISQHFAQYFQRNGWKDGWWVPEEAAERRARGGRGGVGQRGQRER